MANPTLTGSLDKQSYAPGDVMTATLQYADADNLTTTSRWSATDAEGHVVQISLAATIHDPVTVKNDSDDGGRTWTKVSDDGHTAIFTATA